MLNLKNTLIALALLSTILSKGVAALQFPLLEQGDIVGALQTTTVQVGESLGEIGRKFDVGVYEMIEANPALDPWVPTVGATVLLPTEFILPKPRVGLVLNLAEMRLYYFDDKAHTVTTHPLGIGKKGWSTPLGESLITHKKKNPPWYPPKSIHKEHLEKKDPLPAVVPGGTPENPLGLYALYLHKTGLASKGDFLIHGTNSPAGIGVRGTHGCIRLFPEDIKSLFEQIPVGTPVRIIHEPYKVGWKDKHLYLEAHQPLTEAHYAASGSLDRLSKIINGAIKEPHWVNWASAKMAVKHPNGYPVRID